MVAFCTTAAAERLAAGERYPLATLAQAYAAAGFDAAAKNTAVFVAASDVHYGYCGEEGMLPIIRADAAFIVLRFSSQRKSRQTRYQDK
jgi:hypothetical protein